MRQLRAFLCLFSWLSLCAAGAQAQVLSGAGSTFAAPLYVAAAEKLGGKHQFSLNYSSVGSAEGIKRIHDHSVDFGATDQPLNRQELNSSGLLQFPTAIGGVAVTANLPGFNVSQLKLDGPVLADIFLGKIKSWNDARIAELNPGQSLPRTPIKVIVRAEGSGTAYLFGRYLSRVSTEWKERGRAAVASATSVPSNATVLQAIQASAGAIGYLEYGYAQDNKLPVVQLRNAFGTFVSPNSDTIAAAVRAADWELMFMDQNPTFEIDTVNVACPSCWPITGLTYVVVSRRWIENNKGNAFMRFLEALLNDGDAVAKEENYVTLPSRAKNLVKVTLRSQLQDGKGNRLRTLLERMEFPHELLARAD
jgi:phosphate transport system substrate-binding protein